MKEETVPEPKEIDVDLPPSDGKEAIKDYTIAEPDLLYITVWKEPELTTKVSVRPDGKISFPLLNDIYVRGLTPDELKTMLTEKLSTYIKYPLVYVQVEKIRSQRVYVLGAIERPQVIPLTHKTTLLEAVTLAGGMKTGEFGEEVGDLNNAYVTRNDSILDIDFYKLLRENDMTQNIYLKSGDFIYIPFAVSPGTEVFVLGEVNSPGVKPLKKGATLVEIIAKAGGLKRDDASPSINIIRGGLKNPEVITVNYNKIFEGEVSQNLLLENQDIIYVSSTYLTQWNRIVNKILPSLRLLLYPASYRDTYTTGGGLRMDTGLPSSGTQTTPVIP